MKIKSFYDVIIVGGGPAGSMAAYEIAKAGYSVCVFEKDRDIGYPVRCGEAIGYNGLNQYFEPKKNWIAAEIKGATLVSPKNHRINVDFKNETGYILNRRVFDYDLAKIAVNEGAEVFTRCYVNDLIFENDHACGVKIKYFDDILEVRSKIVIGADGIESRIGRWGGIKTKVRLKDMESCVQYSVSNIDISQEKMIMFVGKNYAPGGYLWIFPKGDRSANIGIGISGNYAKNGKSAKSYLDDFINKFYPEVSILTTVCGGVSCPKPMAEPVNNGLMLVGDAAHQINPMTGGGIASGMRGGKIAGQIASIALEKSDFSKQFLMKYPKRMFKEFGNNHNRFYRIKESIHRLEDDDLSYIAEKVAKIPENKRTLSSIFKHAVYKKPSLAIDVLKVFAGV